MENKKWYDNKLTTHLLLVFLFPVGLYALWKSNTIAQWWKIIATIIVILAVATNFSNQELTETGEIGDVKNVEKKRGVEILQHSANYNSTLKSYTIHCRVKNNTSKLVSYVDFKTTFYNKEGGIVGTGFGNTLNIAAGVEKTVDIFALDIDNAENYIVEIDNVMY